MTAARKTHDIAAASGVLFLFGTHHNPRNSVVARGLSCFCRATDTIHNLSLCKDTWVPFARVIHNETLYVYSRESVSLSDLTLRRPDLYGGAATPSHPEIPKFRPAPSARYSSAPAQLRPDVRPLAGPRPGALCIRVCCVGVEPCPVFLRQRANRAHVGGGGQRQLRTDRSLFPNSASVCSPSPKRGASSRPNGSPASSAARRARRTGLSAAPGARRRGLCSCSRPSCGRDESTSPHQP